MVWYYDMYFHISFCHMPSHGMYFPSVSDFGPSSGRYGHFWQIRPNLTPAKFPAGFKGFSRTAVACGLFTAKSNDTSFDLLSTEWVDGLSHSQLHLGLCWILEKAAQGVAQCEVSATRVVVDAALLRGGKSRGGGHRIANISRNCGRI